MFRVVEEKFTTETDAILAGVAMGALAAFGRPQSERRIRRRDIETRG